VKLKVKYSALARKDVLSIKTWTYRTFGSAQAKQYIGQIQQSLDLIAENPGLARPADHVALGLFRVESGSHVIYFRFAEASINIVRVLHGRQDASNWL
jgi:toxin ParE1/3/4